ncbi:DNA invertase Pin-like site-specific DNA recombinase [Desulfitispora alkaliphila]|uniref:recombinase family protein n=1 Tax=Desulfitispora alkaliphila TaxID=622674 RepID=UPI003D262330
MDQSEKGMWVKTLWAPLDELNQSPLESSELGIKVAAYCRVSPGVDAKIKSLENQVKHYTHFIKNKPNWKFVGIYFDDGVTGANYKNRRGFQRLLRHCQEGRIDLILTKNISRFSRNSEELLAIVNQLKEQNVGIYFEKENIDTSIEYNKFLLSTYIALAQEEIENISQSTKWGFEKKFMKGKPMYSPLLGYDVIKNQDHSTLQINQEAEAVRKIFDMFLSGLPLAEIARQLMKQGIKTSVGKDLWRGSTVKNILTNLTYTGNKLTRERGKDIFTTSATKGKRDQILIENCHPAIISTEVFNLAQKRLEEIKPKQNHNKKKTKSSLSGRMNCGHCGYKLTNYPTRGVNYWKCNPSDVGVCEFKSLKEDLLQEMMLKAIELKYGFQTKKMLTEIQVINRNDHFEFHRLKYLTEIEMAAKSAASKTEELEEDYLAFEDRIAKIEDDRKYRDIAINWLKNNPDEFLEGVTIEHMRAWIREMTIYNSEDFIITWVDDTQTVVGNCKKEISPITSSIEEFSFKATSSVEEPSPITSPIEEFNPKATSPVEEPSPKADSPIEAFTFKVINPDGKLREEVEEVSQSLEVIKIEPGQGGLILNDIQQKLAKYKTRKEKAKLRTAAYCRISTDRDEQTTSLKTQVAYYTYRILKDPNYEYAGIFADEGISGKSLKNRTEFLKLIDECKAGNVDLILTKSISRFSRNALDVLETVRMLKSLPKPVFVFFEKENISTKDENSEIMISIFGSIAQEESLNISSSIAWGKRKYAERGIVKAGTKNYGYENNQFTIKEEEALVVKRIYQETLAGKNMTQIAKELTDDGVKSPHGKKRWYGGTVRSILTNEVYRGNYLYQKRYTQDVLAGKIAPNNGELPQYFIEQHHEPIISSSDWEEVQVILKERTETFAKKERNKYPKDQYKNKAFIKKFTCGECGNLIGHQRYVEKNYEMHNWICGLGHSYYISERCEARRFQQKYLELHFLKTLLDIKNSIEFKNTVEGLISKTELTEEEEALEKDLRKRMEALNQKLYEAVDEEINKDGQDSKKVDELTEAIVELQTQLKIYSDRRRRAKLDREELSWLMKELKKIDEKISFKWLSHGKRIPFPEDIFTRVVESGVIFKDGRIIYHLKPGLEWSIDFNYEDYKKMTNDSKALERKAKKEKFLKGPEVRALLEFCKEPRSFIEMFKFMNKIMFISESHLRAAIINPLLEKEILKKTFPDDLYNKKQRYYSV